MNENNETETTEVATETAETPANKGGAQNTYPFETKAAIKARCLVDFDFATKCLSVLVARQTKTEQDEKVTKIKNARGLMSSHASAGTTLNAKIASGEALTSEEEAKVCEMTSHYSKQLADHYRVEQLRASKGDKEIRALARTFGVIS